MDKPTTQIYVFNGYVLSKIQIALPSFQMWSQDLYTASNSDV